MKENKIDFIICYSNEACLDKSIACINELIVPDGYDVDIIGASEADSLSEAYNALMKQSDAKYKVYIYENLYITDKFFLVNAVRVFEQRDNLGMLGVMGQKKYSEEAKWGEWDCGTIGIVNETRAEVITTQNSLTDTIVDVINGCLIMTSVDFEWNSMKNDANGYVDLEHSKTMRENGYEMLVLHQDQPICIYEAGLSIYERYDFYSSDAGCHYIMPNTVDDQPLVSVILCVYNGENFVAKSIESILSQTYKKLQIVVVDDCSTDKSRDVINFYAKQDNRIETVFLSQNGNICNAANSAYSRCKGKYIASIGHDDIWYDDKIRRQVEFMEAHEKVAVCFSFCDIINQSGEIISEGAGNGIFHLFRQKNHTRREWIEILFFGRNCLCAPSSLIRTECIKDELYNLALVQLQDYDLWLRLLKYFDIYIIQEQLMKYRWFVGETQNLSSATPEKNNRICHEIGYLKAQFIDNIDDKEFVNLFYDHLIDKEVKDSNDIKCEKAFILKKIENCRCYDRFMELINCTETRESLENKYHFGLDEFYSFNMTSMNFDSELLYMILELKQMVDCLNL